MASQRKIYSALEVANIVTNECDNGFDEIFLHNTTESAGLKQLQIIDFPE